MKHHNQLLIIGAGGHGRVVADVALKMNRYQAVAFLDDGDTQSSMGLKVIGKSSDADQYICDYDIFVAIGNNKIRNAIQSQLESSQANIPTLVHPSAVIGQQVELGAGTVVMAGAVINCCSKIGSGCIVNTGATIDHDNIIENYVHISPGAHIAGTVRVGKSTWIGIGSVVSNDVSIICDCMIGAGTVVVKDITIPGTYIGVPGRRID